MRCGDCKFFKLYPKHEYEWREKIQGTKPLNKGKIGTCELTEYCDQFAQIPELEQTNKMISASEWGDQSEIIVGENFGCIHFDKKEGA